MSDKARTVAAMDSETLCAAALDFQRNYDTCPRESIGEWLIACRFEQAERFQRMITGGDPTLSEGGEG